MRAGFGLNILTRTRSVFDCCSPLQLLGGDGGEPDLFDFTAKRQPPPRRSGALARREGGRGWRSPKALFARQY